MIKNNFKFVFILLVIILLVSSVSAYTRSNPKYVNIGLQGGGLEFNNDHCQAGTDFVLQISPFGCTPAVVRSDLLAEQNVPVFCQIGATQINPLIKVEAIDGIRFSGQYPSEVQGIGFHPAQAALGTKTNLNSPILNNIGYAVIVLKQQKNTSSLPDFVEGNLTAKIKYDIKNAFGIGRTTLVLPEFTDREWEDEKLNYGFWNGQAYMRVQGIDEDSATIILENDVRELSKVTLEVGKKSRRLNLPGLECQAGLQLKLDGVVNPATRVRLSVGGDMIEVADEESFLENRCKVKKIDKRGLVQKVKIKCKEDEERYEGSEIEMDGYRFDSIGYAGIEADDDKKRSMRNFDLHDINPYDN